MSPYRESREPQPGVVPRTLPRILPRLPVPMLGLLIAVSALHAACIGPTPEDPLTDDAGFTEDAGAGNFSVVQPDASPIDAPSDDSAEDRADGMRYGDGYGR